MLPETLLITDEYGLLSKSIDHPGFGKVQAKIARSMGVSGDRAGAILAASTRRSSKKAKKRNPRLNRVK